jgi:hypothetical protein
VFDFAKWEVKSPRDYCGRKFKISLGDKYNKPKILETKEDIADAVTKFKIIEVPIEHKQSFIDDIIGCLTGDTKIPLLSGGFKSIKELVGIKDFYVYSIDSMGKIVPGRAYDVRLTKQKADIYKVVLDNGRCIRCTGNHPFLMRDGSYKEARLLVPKESLMPLYRNLNNKGYERTKVVSVVKDGYADVYDMSVDKYNNFALDAGVFVHNSLRDIGGISSDDVSKRKFIPSETFLHKCYSGEMINPFTMETIMTGLAEPANLSLYFDASKIRMPRDVPWYVHGDWAKNGDAFGLAMSAIAGYTMINVTQENGTIAQKKVPIIETAFVVRVKAYPNDQIPQYTIRDFILALRGLGFHIKRYSSDLDLATTDTRQLLEHAGIKTAYISVDKTPKWYTTFRDMIYEQRWRCFMHSYLHFELANLEQDPETHDIDHPEIVETIAILDDGDAKEVVLEGSKDVADACAGTIANILTAIDDDNPIDIEAMRDIQTKITGAAKHGERVDEIELTRKLIGVHLSDGQRSTKDLSKFRNILKKVR